MSENGCFPSRYQRDVRLKLQSSKYLNVWMPVPLYLSGVVIIFAFPLSKSGIFDLILGENISFSDSLLGLRPVCPEPCRDLQKRPQGHPVQLSEIFVETVVQNLVHMRWYGCLRV
jgi:hypothetical protein